MKKKVKKDETKKKFAFTKELEGLILILLGLIGFLPSSVAGNLICGFSIFLFGSWYVIALIFALILGIYLLAKRSYPNYFTQRLIGIYTIVLALLIFSHMEFINNMQDGSIGVFKETLNKVLESVNNIKSNGFDYIGARNTGGGMIGALFCTLFVKVFSQQGTLIATILITVFGVVMLFDINFASLFKSIFGFIKKLFKRKEKVSPSGEGLTLESIEKQINDEDEDEEDNKVIITSIDDLKNMNNVKEVPAHEESAPVIPEKHEEAIHRQYVLPPINLLDMPQKTKNLASTEFITSNTKILERVLGDFQIIGKVVEVHVGPTVTQYEMELKAGTKVSRVLSINREIALALAAKDVRVEAPIPGKNTIGIEIPNPVQSDVRMREIIEGIPSKYKDNKLIAPLGMDIMGNIQFALINKMPHMLIAGATGSGKSVCINNIIMSIIMRCKPDEVKLVLVDPKKVELNVYDNIPHLLIPVVTDPKKASQALQRIVVEMDKRYTMFHDTETKNLDSYNEYVDKVNAKNPGSMERLPFILIVIDELADLMLVAAKEVEESITRITQLARAAGIHLIVATQRPSTDVITGLIKANIPSRISFAVSSSIDSRTILDMMGAEKLLGRGDMLFLPMGENTPIRIQGSYVSEDEIKRVVDHVKSFASASYDEEFLNPTTEHTQETAVKEEYSDPMYNEVLEFAVRVGKISASLIQRKFHIGYNRAASLMDTFEENGVVGSQSGSKPRDVLIKLEEGGK